MVILRVYPVHNKNCNDLSIQLKEQLNWIELKWKAIELPLMIWSLKAFSSPIILARRYSNGQRVFMTLLLKKAQICQNDS